MSESVYNYSAWWADRLRAEADGVPFSTQAYDIRYLVADKPTPVPPAGQG